MKNNYSVKFLLYAIAVLFLGVACDKDPVEPTPLTTPFNMQAQTSGESVKISYAQGETLYEYAAALFLPEEFSDLSDANKMAAIISKVEEQGAVQGKVDGKYIFKGNGVVELDNWSTEPETRYVVAAVAYNANFAQVSEVQTVQITTPKGDEPEPDPDAEFKSVTVSDATQTGFTVSVELGTYQGTYAIVLSSPEDIEDFGGAEAYVDAYLEDDIERYATNYSEPDGYYVFDDDVVLNTDGVWTVSGDTEYVMIVFGAEGDGTYANVLTDIVVSEPITTLPEELPYPADIELATADFGDVEISNITNSSYDYSITPADEDMNYLIFQFTDEEYNTTFPTDEDRILAIYETFNFLADYYGYSFAELIEAQSAPGSFADAYDELETETTYHFVAFGIDLNSFQPLTAVEERTVTTLPPPAITESLESVTVSDVTFQDAKVTIDAGTYDGYYHIYPAPVSMVDGPADDYGYEGDYEAAFLGAVEYLLSSSYEFDPEFEYSYLYYFTGSQDIMISDNLWMIEPEDEYYLLAAGVDSQGNLTTNVIKSEKFTTTAAPAFDIDIDIYDIKETTCNVDFTPNINSVYYYNNIFLRSDVDDGVVTVESITSDPWFTYYLNYGPLSYDPEEITLKAGTEYCVMAFAYDLDTEQVSSDVFLEYFTTAGESLPPLTMPTEVTIPDVEFGAIELLSNDENGAKIDVRPNADVENYVYFFVTKDEYTELGGTDEALVLFDFARYQYDVDEEYEDNYRDAMTYYLRQGDLSRTEGWLEGDTEYVFYAYGMDILTGLPTTKLAKVEFITPPSSLDAPSRVVAPQPERQVKAFSSFVEREMNGNAQKMISLSASSIEPSAEFRERMLKAQNPVAVAQRHINENRFSEVNREVKIVNRKVRR